MSRPILADVNTILANPLQIGVITLGVLGFGVLYSGYLAMAALEESERTQIRQKLGDLTGWQRPMRAYVLMNPKVGRNLIARRRMYLGALLLAAAAIAWRFVR